MVKILELVGALIVIFTIIGMVKEANRHGIHRLTWRWFSGNAYHGKNITNATWTRRATKVHTDSGTAIAWHHIPRLHRAAYRTLGTFLAIAIAIGLFKNRSMTIKGLIVAGIILTVTGIYFGIRDLRRWHTDRTIVTPLAMALAPQLDIPETAAQNSFILAPNALTIKEGEIGRLILPPQFPATPKQREGLEHLIFSRMPIEIDFAWKTKVNPQYLALMASPKPPSMVPFAQFIQIMEACKQGQVFLGLDRKGEPFYGSFIMDDPHWGFSVGSGRGKSTMLQATAAQILHNEILAKIFAIDPKFSSLTPLVGVPGVEVACNPLAIHEFWDMVYRVKMIMLDRLEQQKRNPTLEFPTNVLMIDEINTFAAMSRTQWSLIDVGESIGVSDIVKPAKMTTPLVWGDIAQILWMGRQSNTHIIAVGQRLDDRATGGIGLRDSLGLRGLAGFRKNQYEMLIGNTPVPKSQKPKGRWLYSDGSDETWVQNVYGKPDQIRDYAMANRIASANGGVVLTKDEVKPSRIEIVKP